MNQDDEIEQLLKQSFEGVDSAVEKIISDKSRTEQIRQQIEQDWLQQVQAKKPNLKPAFSPLIFLAMAATVVIAVVATIFTLNFRSMDADSLQLQFASVLLLKGEVTIHDNLTNQDSPATDSLSSVDFGSSLVTNDESFISILLGQNANIRLGENSRLTLLSSTEVVLDRGALYFETVDNKYPTKVSVSTPLGKISNLGTQYQVHLSEQSDSLGNSTHEIKIMVREGQVKLNDSRASGKELSVDAGHLAVVDQAWTIAKQELNPYGPEWMWLESLTPTFNLDGQSLHDYAAWVCRQKGWRLNFDSSRTRNLARSTQLSGSTELLGIDDSLAAVFSTTSMKYNVIDGMLEIVQ